MTVDRKAIRDLHVARDARRNYATMALELEQLARSFEKEGRPKRAAQTRDAARIARRASRAERVGS